MLTKEEMSDPHLRHLFDGNPDIDIYSQNFVNISVGAPSPDLLKNCTSLMEKATSHRMV